MTRRLLGVFVLTALGVASVLGETVTDTGECSVEGATRTFKTGQQRISTTKCESKTGVPPIKKGDKITRTRVVPQPAPIPQPTPVPPSGRLLQAGDLVKLGEFFVPQIGADFDYRQTGLSYNPANDSLFVAIESPGYTPTLNKIVEISIPPIGGTATILQSALPDPTEGKYTQVDGGSQLTRGTLVTGD